MTDNTERPQAGWGFGVWWVLATIVGFAVGVGPTFGVGVFGVVAFGATVGIAQWLVLRRHVSRSGWWVLATTVGLVMAVALLLAVSDAVSEAVDEVVDQAVDVAVEDAVGGRAVFFVVSEAVEVAVVDVVEDALEEAVEEAGGGAVASAMAESMLAALEDGLGEVVEEAVEEAVYGGAAGNLWTVSEFVGDEVVCFVEEANEDAWEEGGEGAVVSAVQEALDEAFLGEAVREAVASAMEEAGGGALEVGAAAFGDAPEGEAVGDAVGLGVGLAVGGATVGIAQWFVLRRRVSRAGWWVLASVVGFAPAAAGVLAALAEIAKGFGIGGGDGLSERCGLGLGPCHVRGNSRGCHGLAVAPTGGCGATSAERPTPETLV